MDTHRLKRSLAALNRYTQQGSSNEPPGRTCELCAAPLFERHRHLLDMRSRQVTCACDPCALRFHDVVDGAYKLIPRDAMSLPKFRISDQQWDSLALPINLVFMYRTEEGVAAMYPSPAGATQSLLTSDAWEQMVRENQMLANLRADTEALLINRIGSERDYFIVPIDKCYRLVGLIRLHWRGLSGGEQVWKEISSFFDALKEESRPAKEVIHA